MKKGGGKGGGGGKKEAEYKNKAGTAWSHSYLNQKPWHPLSYANQRRKWIAEQTHSERARKVDEVAREFSQEQDFFRQTAMLTKKEKEKMEVMQAVSFMYVRPPGYNPESARAAEITNEKKKSAIEASETSSSGAPIQSNVLADEKKRRVKDIYGKAIPTEEEFPVLKNAPRLESGGVARVKPFAIEIRNVKCARCGAFGHQSGDRECPWKDVIMPNEEARQRRDDPLNAIMACSMSSEPAKWELKRQFGRMSPPRGGFQPDDPNQQIIPEDIYDEYGGFLGDESVPQVLASLSTEISRPHRNKDKKHTKKRKHRHKHYTSESSSDEEKKNEKKKKKRHKLGKGKERRNTKGSSRTRKCESLSSLSSSSESDSN